MSTKVFVSYAREDLAYKNKILSQLLVLENQGLLSTWSDAKVEPGLQWQEELTRELRSAGIVLLLITANFLNSEFILNTEIAELLELHRKSGLRIIPVLCRPCTWEAVAWLRPLDIWPETRTPLWKQETDDPEQQLSDLAREIARIVGLPMGPQPSLDDAGRRASELPGHVAGVTEGPDGRWRFRNGTPLSLRFGRDRR